MKNYEFELTSGHNIEIWCTLWYDFPEDIWIITGIEIDTCTLFYYDQDTGNETIVRLNVDKNGHLEPIFKNLEIEIIKKIEEIESC